MWLKELLIIEKLSISKSPLFSFECQYFKSCVLDSVLDGKLLDNIHVLDHVAELLEADLSVHVLVSFNDFAIHQLLQLHIGKIATNHHLQHPEEFTIRDVSIVVDVIDLESKSELLFMGGTSVEAVQALHKF